MKTYLKALAVMTVLSFAAGYASAEMPNGYDSIQRSLQYEQQNAVRNTMQRRMNQQYYNDRLQNEIREQQDDMNYYQQQEHMRNQGWGRPGLDGGAR